MPSDTPTTDILAAVDLGSNSFHMIVARLDNGQLKTIDRIKEPVRLGEGLNENKHLTDKVAKRALDCLSRFSQRIGDLGHESVRAVGTNTLRRIDDGGEFLRLAEQTLGHSIDIIAGREEARLVYLGVAHGLAVSDQKRLVIDIGGGSTEMILGQQMHPYQMDSLFMGCVGISQQFFGDGKITRKSMDAAVLACRLEIHPVAAAYHQRNWQEAVGSSGTIRAVRDVLQAEDDSDTSISKKALKRLNKAVVDAGSIDNLDFPGLTESRKPVFAGGVAVLSAVFKALGIERMRVSDLALKEGLAYELLGNIQHHDIREQTVNSLVDRYSLDSKQGDLVASTAISLLNQVVVQWDLDDPESQLLLAWAARLCEIGLAISHSGYHKHGAYILANGDLQGFSRRQQMILATLVQSHRNKFLKDGEVELSKSDLLLCQRLGIILRLSVLMHRGHSHTGKPDPTISVHKKEVNLSFPDNWLHEHPLTLAELAAESKILANAGYQLNYY